MQREGHEDVVELMSSLRRILDVSHGHASFVAGEIQEIARLALVDQYRREISRQSRAP